MEVTDSTMARRADSSAREVVSLMLLDINPTMVGTKDRMEAPADQRAVKSLGTLSMIHWSI